MSFTEAFKAIPTDLARCPTTSKKLARCSQLVRLFVEEISGLVTKVPYGYRALRTHRKLPRRGERDGRVEHGVAMSRDVRYDDGERCVMDIYVPEGLVEGENAPVALFVHGGVWASGEKWQFSPMATALAREGVVCCVATYSLYPRADAVQMWDEISRAISWTMDNIETYGGDANRVSVVGHSAGAQLCARALLQRGGVKNVKSKTSTREWHRDSRMPRKFIGIAGVYDIGYHYEYEDSRGVAIVSTMARAMNGAENFDMCSPARLMPRRKRDGRSVVPGPDNLTGDVMAKMAGFYRKSEDVAESLEEEVAFPPTVLMAGCADITVPWHESADFYWKLQDAGVPSRMLLYLKEDHVDFVLNWNEKGSGKDTADGNDYLEPYTRDFVRMLKD
ncbi:Carboxylesterase, type B [Ostreococcus tauri]|uniref:protein-S-isoprenylcysteine alpha-carbonyl methylesterase n=1 Tax=Ostreococcus tauri TaxID=70448 RepID=A0A090LYQ2_OSTTA|nr:Carboxylesterase, type B [Ostreococcus tauri]CEF97145.1 Carboxylesterase, type B [Ostreococcus tauri]|eukprot:XP_022838511.1 Carboxylesterase, type B [Ostreococcus tauri]